MSESTRPDEGYPDLHGGNIAQFAAHRLKVQNDVMWQYSEVLGQRIAAFEEVTQ